MSRCYWVRGVTRPTEAAEAALLSDDYIGYQVDSTWTSVRTIMW